MIACALRNFQRNYGYDAQNGARIFVELKSLRHIIAPNCDLPDRSCPRRLRRSPRPDRGRPAEFSRMDDTAMDDTAMDQGNELKLTPKANCATQAHFDGDEARDHLTYALPRPLNCTSREFQTARRNFQDSFHVDQRAFVNLDSLPCHGRHSHCPNSRRLRCFEAAEKPSRLRPRGCFKRRRRGRPRRSDRAGEGKGNVHGDDDDGRSHAPRRSLESLGDAQRSGGPEVLHPRMPVAGQDRRHVVRGGRQGQDRAGRRHLQRQSRSFPTSCRARAT